MAKELAIGKRAKISEAQQYMLLAVLGASVVLGVGIAFTVHFVQQIAFNIKVIAAKEEAVSAYSDTIKKTGICISPRGSVYSIEELNQCDPDNIDISQIPGTLRANILESLAANPALNSVPKETSTGCINPSTGKNYTYGELDSIYDSAEDATGRSAASRLIRSCSALRVIPDALPAFKNEEALLASLNKLFLATGIEPESLSPSGTTAATDMGVGMNSITVNLSLDEANSGTASNLLNNIERSIREFNIETASIEWGGSDNLIFNAQATAYYMDKSSITEIEKTISVDSAESTTTEGETE